MKNLFQKNNTENGVALLLTTIIISVVMIIAVLISDIVVTQLKLSGDISDATIAIYAADTGAECQLYNIRHEASLKCYTVDVNSDGQITMSNGATASTTVSSTPPIFDIKSLGVYRGASRQFEVFSSQ